jgi:hypothetical protein
MNCILPISPSPSRPRARVRLHAWAAVLAVIALVPAALAQSSGGPYTLRKYVIANGGVQSGGGAAAVTATAAEVAAGVVEGGGFRATIGFHPAAGGGAPPLFADGFE